MTTPSHTPPKTIAFWPTLGLIAAGDFVTKRLAESSLTLHLPYDVIDPWVRLTLTYNTGAAMNLSLGDFSRVVLSVVAALMLVVLYRMYRSAAPGDVWQALALGLVAGGAAGNLVDRLRSARGVVDFIDVGTADWRFWTFNVADSGVTVGAIVLALILWRKPEAPRAPELAPEPAPQPAPQLTRESSPVAARPEGAQAG